MSRTTQLWLVGTLTALLFLVMVIYSQSLQPSIPCLQLTYSNSAFQTILKQWGPAGVARFRAHFTIDFPFLVSYGLFGYLLAKWSSLFAKQSVFSRSLLTWTLPAAAALDTAENLLHLYLTAGIAANPSALYLTAGIVATSKWLLIVAFVLSALYARVRKS